MTYVHYYTFQTQIVNATTFFTAATGVMFIIFSSLTVNEKEKSIVSRIKKDKRINKS